MKHKTTFLMAVMALLLMITGAAHAAVDEADVKRIESSLQSLKTLRADFVQTAYDGGQVTGKFFMSRPGRLRFEYNELDDFIVADGKFIYYYDSQMKQQSNTQISNSLADFLLRPNISLSGDITVTETSRDGGLVNATLVMTDEPSAGSLTLGFVDAGHGRMQLKRWAVTDSQNLTTSVVLSDVKTGQTFDKNMFYYIDPDRFRPQYN